MAPVTATRAGVAAALQDANGDLTAPVGSQIKTLEQWVNDAIANQTRRRGRRTERRRRRNPTEFYATVVEQLETDVCPCCELARSAFGDVDNDSDLATTPMAVDPENLQKVLDFLKYIFENLLPILLKLI